MIFVEKNSAGKIVAWSKNRQAGFEEFDFNEDLVRGWDEYFYKPEEVPTPPGPTLEDQLATIEARYAPKIAALREGIMSAYLTAGAIMDDNVSGLRTEWAAVIAQRNAEMEALLI